MESATTIAEHLDFILAGASRRRKAPRWPPDIFALASSLLFVSGGYCAASCNWPPRGNPRSWVKRTKLVGRGWRRDFNTAVPKRVQELWTTLLKSKSLKVSDLPQNLPVCLVLIELVATADEASAGAGVPFDPASRDDFYSQVEVLLGLSNASSTGANLCDETRNSVIRVLPKMLAPQSGFTQRSFSHHLALTVGSEIHPYWYAANVQPDSKSLDLLILPWPIKISRTDFREVPPTNATMRNVANGYAFFEFAHKNRIETSNDVLLAVKQAALVGGHVDAVVLPEYALSEEEFDRISQILLLQGIYLIAGIKGSRNAIGTLENYARFNIPWGGYSVPVRQSKHHRWKLDPPQIKNYDLPLSKRKQFWEHIPIKDRTLTFLCMRDWLALCVLICEDLARPDPVGDLIRAVGPNLVIALLLDGPQLKTRWSSRYATTLADDPGSSVLTLTCGGMTRLSKPPSGKANTSAGKIALWKDVRGQAHEIDIRNGEAALVHIEVEEREEWTADGRGNNGVSGHPILKKVMYWGKNKRVREYAV